MVGAGVVAVALAHAVNCSPAQPPAAALAAWSPDGAHIAYTVPYDETAAIQLAEPGAPLPIGGYVSYDSAPVELVWSPLGDAIAFEKRTGAIEVLSLGRNGGSRELVHAEAGKTTELGDWSPDGRQLVFARDGHIHALDVGTGDIRYLVDGLHPTWSPDGQEIAFGVGDELRAIKPDGSGLRTVAVAVAPIGAVTWSPDSTRLALLVKNIGTVTRFGGVPVYYGQAEPPIAWRENGIFYSLASVAPAIIRTWRLDPETGRSVALTRLPQKADARFLDATRDGRFVAYRLDVDYVPTGVRLVGGDGRGDRPLLACIGTARPDRVRGTRFNDVIRVDGGGRDRVDCGAGRDIVYADRRDRVAQDCEVRRLP